MTKASMQSLWGTAPLSGGSAAYVEDLYEQFMHDPTSVTSDWQDYFAGLDGQADVSHASIRAQFAQLAKRRVSVGGGDAEKERKQAYVWRLIAVYRRIGHQQAKLDPLNLAERMDIPDLKPSYYGLDDSDMQSSFDPGNYLGFTDKVSLQNLLASLEQTYSGSIGTEYMHITDHAQTTWLQERLETTGAKGQFTSAQKQVIYDRLVAAEGLEKYLGTRYVGQKRFGLEGAESLIPALYELVQCSGAQGVKDIIIGMAHRGRLNVLVNILGKSPAELFDEFEGKIPDAENGGSGDVKYHKGFSSSVETAGGEVHLALAFNPSHLEIIAPVVEGSVRARQERRYDKARDLVLPVLLHGDAAFAGQGVVMETFSLSQARGYRTGGTVHIIINNQIGFTTSNPLDARSSLYCTDVAKMVQAPVLHVNADDPEAVVFAMQAAFDFRMKFKKDIVIDLVCYRRHGHNEADEPSITQPLMYQTIKKHHTATRLYGDALVAAGELSAAEVKEKADSYRDKLDAGESVMDVVPGASRDQYAVDWTPYLGQDLLTDAHTAVDKATLKKLGEQLQQLPEGFVLQPQVAREMKMREKMLAEEIPLNWGCAENLAYARLVTQGHAVRLSGQDCGRGTFSHRHAMLHDQASQTVHVPLQDMAENQANFTVINSVLSEAAVLGFEYGYSSAEPRVLTIWEAQFGDFANGAQVVIDQFISSGEQKWARVCGLVMLLPHGYEGQGPEHSSARLERYLQLCAQHNMQVCVPSTPAQIFHLLSRQILRPVRKPLIVMTPKSLLRHKLATSALEELSEGSFQLVIPEVEKLSVGKVTRVVICSGKVYYDLLQQRDIEQRSDVALLRVEQLYPFPEKELSAELASYVKAKEVIWCQEEPMNQGAWYAAQHRMRQCLAAGQKLTYAGRSHSASPAVGSAQVHAEQQKRLVKEALG